MADNNTDPFPELLSVYRRESASKINQLSRKVANIKLNSEQTGDSGGSSSRQHGSGLRPRNSRKTSLNAWRHPNATHKLATMGSGESGVANCNKSKDEIAEKESDVIFDSDDDLSLDAFDSYTGEKNHEEHKKTKWFKVFFDNLSRMSSEEITSSKRPFHCPACEGGPGAIDWYHGLQPLLNHSRTIQSRSAKLHRLFAKTLEEECYRRRASLTTPSEACGMWEGLDNKVKDHEIVWPPVVVIMNTRSQRHLSEKWSGMGNQGLLDRFHNYAALKARQAYGPQGHRGMGVLIFDTSAAGYLEAVRLHKHFKEQGRDREAWNRCKNPFGPDGKRQLYGYLASREDMDIFNQHSRGRSRLKFEMRSYQEMVESKIKDINEDSQQLNYYKNKMAKEQMKSQVPEDSFCEASENLCLEIEEYRVVRGQTKEQNQQRKGKMGEHESFFQKQIQLIEQAIAEADEFKKSQEGTTGDEPYCLDSAFYERHRRRLQEVCSMMRSKQEHFQKEQKELEKGSASESRQNK